MARTTSEERLLAPAASAASIILASTGIACLLVASYGFYRFIVTGRESIAFVYTILPVIVAGLFFYSLRLTPERKLKLTLVVLSTAVSLYAFEILVTLRNLPSSLKAREINARERAAEKEGRDFDTRSKLQVVNDLRAKGIEAYASAAPLNLLLEKPISALESLDHLQLKSQIMVDGREILPLSGISKAMTVLCNESGSYTLYESDRHGFHNPTGLWERGGVDIVALGDSFTHGFCVPSDENFVALIRDRYPATLNLGMLGHGPLLMLASLIEYRAVKPKIILWFYFEGNDLRDLRIEKNSALLTRYLTGDFSQYLYHRQHQVDEALISYAKTTQENRLGKLEELLHMGELVSIFKLYQFRRWVGLANGGSKRLRQKNNHADLMNLLTETLSKADEFVKIWGGKLYFVYLPEWESFGNPSNVDDRRELVLNVVNEAGIPLIDLYNVFRTQSDPLALFPFRVEGHYNEKGHWLVAEEVLRAIPSWQDGQAKHGASGTDKSRDYSIAKKKGDDS